MALSNYGGKQAISKYTKEFRTLPTSSQAEWVFSKPSSTGEIYITPANKTKSVYINTDLYVKGSIFNTSDINHKEEIEIIPDSKIEKIFNLEPVQYKFKTDDKKRIHYGLIAQDVEKVYPELVSNTNLGFKSVNYTEFVPILLLKMKTMQKEIDELKDQIRSITKDV